MTIICFPFRCLSLQVFIHIPLWLFDFLQFCLLLQRADFNVHPRSDFIYKLYHSFSCFLHVYLTSSCFDCGSWHLEDSFHCWSNKSFQCILYFRLSKTHIIQLWLSPGHGATEASFTYSSGNFSAKSSSLKWICWKFDHAFAKHRSNHDFRWLLLLDFSKHFFTRCSFLFDFGWILGAAHLISQCQFPLCVLAGARPSWFQCAELPELPTPNRRRSSCEIIFFGQARSILLRCQFRLLNRRRRSTIALALRDLRFRFRVVSIHGNLVGLHKILSDLPEPFLQPMISIRVIQYHSTQINMFEYLHNFLLIFMHC